MQQQKAPRTSSQTQQMRDGNQEFIYMGDGKLKPSEGGETHNKKHA